MIGLNNFGRQWEDTAEDSVASFVSVGKSGWYILGREVQDFESSLADYWGLSYAVGVASGLDAIEISLRTLGCKPGDKVLTSPVSAFATTLAILKLGAIPVFADVTDNGLVDLDSARDAIIRDRSIRYFVPVHLYGHALDMRDLAALHQELAVTIIEDCAQSIGATSHGIPTGKVGQAAATSFYPTKNLGAMGDGGAILTDDELCFKAAQSLRDYGQVKKYQHDLVGYNSRLDEVQAGLLRRVSLPRLDTWIRRRREIAARYLTEIESDAAQLPRVPPASISSWHLFPVLIAPDRKSDFWQHMQNHMISIGEHYPIAIPDQRALAQVPFEIAPGGIEQARSFCRSEVSLPIHPYLTEAEVSTVIGAVNIWAG